MSDSKNAGSSAKDAKPEKMEVDGEVCHALC